MKLPTFGSPSTSRKSERKRWASRLMEAVDKTCSSEHTCLGVICQQLDITPHGTIPHLRSKQLSFQDLC